jgi:hypothetical protein
MSNYSETPWVIEVNDGYTSIESKYFTVSTDVNNEDAKRIVDCVNACHGVHTPVEQTLLLQLIKEVRDFVGEYRERVMKGKLKGELIEHDYALYRDLNEMIKLMEQGK